MPTESTFVAAAALVLAAALGWLFAQLGWRDRDPQQSSRVSSDYLRGLNLVLSRRTDEALELFIQMAKVDDETLETHFALGHLFRRRGEVDRAIRVHQNLLARPSLNEGQRHQALLALAEDYLGAGLFDRAEKLFSELRDSETVAEQALQRLVYIYERESEWEQAIETQRRLESLTGERSPQVSHYYCELAERARAAGDLDAAREYLKQTAHGESGGLRGRLIRAAIARQEHGYDEARRLYEQVLGTDKRFISEVLPHLFECCEALGRRDEFERYVESLAATGGTIENDLAYAAVVGGLTGSPALTGCVERFISNDPLLACLVDVDDLRAAGPEERRRIIERVAHGLRELALANARFRCTNCGYGTRRFIWHCPSCKLWESVRPIQKFQFEEVIA